MSDNTGTASDLGTGLGELLTTDAALSTIAELAECGLDSALEEGVLRDLPFVGSVVGIWRTGKTVRDAFLLRKIAGFIATLSDTPASDREEFAVQIADDESYRRRIGEQLVLYIDRQDDLSKPEMLARAFAAMLARTATRDQFFELAACIDRCFTADLPLLADTDGELSLSSEAAARLHSCGLVEPRFGFPLSDAGRPPRYFATSLGRLMAREIVRAE